MVLAVFESAVHFEHSPVCLARDVELVVDVLPDESGEDVPVRESFLFCLRLRTNSARLYGTKLHLKMYALLPLVDAVVEETLSELESETDPCCLFLFLGQEPDHLFVLSHRQPSQRPWPASVCGAPSRRQLSATR